MAKDGDLVRSAREHVFALFRSAPEDARCEFHQFARTRDVVRACREIARGSKLDDDAREVALLCAWFYDACYATGSDDHRRSLELCLEFLEQQHGRRPTREEIVACFSGVENTARATSEPADRAAVQGDAPADVLHDGRLAVLADKNYVQHAELLRLEHHRRSGKTFSDIEWTQHCIEFIDANRYRTRSAQLTLGADRAANRVRLQKLLRRQERELEREHADERSSTKAVVKVTENAFYHFTRIQVGMMEIADHRTRTMIQVNAIMLSLVVALLARRIETSRDLLVPTILLLIVNLTVIFLAIYSMRVARRRLAAEEEHLHMSNLLLATNDSHVTLTEYRDFMNQLMSAPSEFQGKLIEHLYFVRELLLDRGRTLRLTYRIFIYGIAAAVVAFVFVLLRH